ncbi:MAG: amidohydrolase family protein [Oscillospiraceae bacterium]|jgi:predicted TIM-barrel fold metal-dependent hydrolase|nr:amidohydrolase family protein [Oscillospiraceae bacterium]
MERHIPTERPERVIDAHLHFQPKNPHFDAIARTAGHENTAAHLERAYLENAVEHGVVMGNRELVKAWREYPPTLSFCAGVHQHALEPENREAALEACESQLSNPQCVGIKLYAGYCAVPLMDGAYIPYYELAERYGKPVAVHMGVTASPRALLKYCHPLLIDEAATRFPRVRFVMCHFGNPWLMDAAAVLEKNDNVAADLSGLLSGRVDLDEYRVRLGGYMDQLRTWVAYVERYDAFMFGTDWPLVNLSEYIAFICELVPREHWDDVFYGNARRVYLSAG